MVRAVLDACVLVPAALRDILLRAADAGLYQIGWSDEILEEVRRNLVSQLGRSEEQAGRLVDIMRQAFPDAMVSNYAALIETMTNDPKDRHVAAAAVASGAAVIVTSNLRDFPASALADYGMQAQSPDEFLLGLSALSMDQMAQLIREQSADLQRPPKTVADVLGMIARQAPAFAKQMAEALQMDGK